MTVFSRLTASLVLACVATTSLLAIPVAADKAPVARHLKHPQVRAAHHAHGKLNSKGSKRSSAKQKVCGAKSSSSIASSTSTTAVATTTTSKKPAATKNSSSGGGGTTDTTGSGSGGKAGVGWNDGPESYFGNLFKTGKANWYYTWSSWSACSGKSCPEFIPMLWGTDQIGDWQNNVMGQWWEHTLGFNEPDQSGQSAMSVGDAISTWWKYIEPVNAQYKGAPAVTASPNGVSWIKSFIDGCDGCQIDFVPFHFYGMDADAFISTCQNFHSYFPNLPIWVTEWACENYGSDPGNQCSMGDIQAFMSKTQAFLDSTPWIGRYAWFGALTQFPGNFNTENRLISTSGSVTDLGYQYIAW